MAKLAALLESGVNLKTSLREVGLTEIPDQLRLAISLGAPLVPLLRSMNQLEQSCLRAQAELEQALAVPRATRQLLAWLPLITLFLSVAAGLVSIDAVLSPISLICVLLGLALLLLGLWLTKRMLVDKWDEAKAVEEAKLIGLSNAALEKFALDYVASRRK